MIVYGYHCPNCGQEYTSEVRGDTVQAVCRSCNFPGPLKRKYAVNIHNGMEPHFNHTTQSEIRSDKQFARELKVQSDIREDETGIPHNFVPLDPEQARKQVDDSDHVGLEATQRNRVARGLPAYKL